MTSIVQFHCILSCSFMLLGRVVRSNDCDLDEEVWRLTSDSFPEENFAPPIGNGHIATNVLSDTIYMNGFFNGYKEDSHRARLQSTANIDVSFDDGKDTRSYDLDMANGVFYQYIHHPSGDINITYFAHRKYSPLLVVHAIRRRTIPSNANVTFTNDIRRQSDDIYNFTEVLIDNLQTRHWSGYNKVPETKDVPRMKFHQYSANVGRHSSEEFTTYGLDKWIWLTTISTDQDEAFSVYRKALDMGYTELLRQHTQEWKKIWCNGHIRIKGNTELSRNVNAAFYNILSSLPTRQNDVNPFIGLSPGGLSRGGKINPNKTGGPSNDYAGHVFWDMDTWIMPPIMMFYPEMARFMLNSRIRVLDTARTNAKSSGYKGARFPWEQAVTGTETCPWDLAAQYQIHVTADISYAMRQYIYVSTDDDIIQLLSSNGSALALDIARYWASRVSRSDDGVFNILGVMGPDEYHYNINNSVFTNYNAKLSLLLPSFIDKRYNVFNLQQRSELSTFTDIANQLDILFDTKTMFHPQFEHFNLKESIKQSDVVLLGFPLLMPMNQSVRRNDLEIYEKVTDHFGPDTGTWSMHTVGWLELGEEQKAREMFKMLLRNINGPFKVFSEKPADSPDGPRCVNFITGAGGLLQAVIFGYGGIRIRESSLDINPHILPNAIEWTVIGLTYKGFKFDLHINETHHQIKVTKESKSSQEYLYYGASDREEMKFDLNGNYEFLRGKFSLQVKHFTLLNIVGFNTNPRLEFSKLLVLTIVFSEKPADSPDGPRCVNFITGAGGLLQAVIFGYGGIRIRESSLDNNSHILPNAIEWTLIGLTYKGLKFDRHMNETHHQIKVTKESKSLQEYLFLWLIG